MHFDTACKYACAAPRVPVVARCVVGLRRQGSQRTRLRVATATAETGVSQPASPDRQGVYVELDELSSDDGAKQVLAAGAVDTSSGPSSSRSEEGQHRNKEQLGGAQGDAGGKAASSGRPADDASGAEGEGTNEQCEEEEEEELVMPPPHDQDPLLEDVTGMTMHQLCNASEVYNVELAWLSFNWRVFSMALVQGTPLYERLRFIAISAQNLDEFFAKRVGGLMRQREAGSINLKQPSVFYHSWSPERQLELIAKEVKLMVQAQNDVLKQQVLPQLREHGLCITGYTQLSSRGQSKLDDYFRREVELLLTPIRLDPAHPFPYLPSLSLNLAVILQDPRESVKAQNRKDPGGARMEYAIINIPPSLCRWLPVGAEYAAEEGDGWEHGFIPLEQVIMANLSQLFGGMIIRGAHPFRVTRNAELERHEEEADDLLDMISDELRERRFAPFVRLEVDSAMPSDLVEYLTMELDMLDDDVYLISGIQDLGALLQLPVSPMELPSERNLRRKTVWSGSKWKGIRSIFSIIRDGEILVHHPYESFAASTQRLVEEAARDPNVIAIKSTLYRTSSDSPIIAALLKAAENGKQVAVLVELKARFDEARNVGFAQRLEDAGCNVAYGLVGLKTHAKTTLIVRREKAARGGLRTYCHVGTGNYNPSTAGLYCDFGLLSCDPKLGRDLADLFKHLTGLHSQKAVGGYKKLLVANEYMQAELLSMIEAEIANVKDGRMGAICIKVNSLDDKAMVASLYNAAQQGVRVDLIVRGVCRLRPGVPGLSENVRVVSLVGRFLEHHRIYCFYNKGDPTFFISSADWRSRNLNRRVEMGSPVEGTQQKRHLRTCLALYLCDAHAWDMLPSGRYRKGGHRRNEALLAAPLLGMSKDEYDELLRRLEGKDTQQVLMEAMEEMAKQGGSASSSLGL